MMNKKKGFITRLAGVIDSILPSNDSSNATSSQLSKRQREQKYGEWTDLVTVVLYTIEGIKAQDANFLVADKPTYITKFIFYPQDTASKNHLLKILGSNGYSNDSRDDNIFDGEDYRYQFRRMAADTGYHNLDIAPDMLIEISDEELIGAGRIDNIINAGLFEYTHNLAGEDIDDEVIVNPANGTLHQHSEQNQQEQHNQQKQQAENSDNDFANYNSHDTNNHNHNHNNHDTFNSNADSQIIHGANLSSSSYLTNGKSNYNLNNIIDRDSIDSLDNDIQADIQHTFNEPAQKPVENSINNTTAESDISFISLRCTIYDASGNRNQLITEFPCKVGKSSVNDIIVNGKFVSREHLTISEVAGQFYIQDRSSNHSYLSNAAHNVEEVLAESDTMLLTGKTVVLLGGQSERFDQHPKLVFDIAQPCANQSARQQIDDSAVKKQGMVTPLNSSDMSYDTADIAQKSQSSTTQSETKNLSTKQSATISTVNEANPASKLGMVTKLAPLFKLTITTASGEQTCAVDRLPWTLGRAGTNSIVNIAAGVQTTISRQHITLTAYDDLAQTVTVLVDGRNGASVIDETTEQSQKYRHGDSFELALEQAVKLGLDKPAVTFKISVDEDCL